MSDKVLVVEYWHKGGISEKWIKLDDYVNLLNEFNQLKADCEALAMAHTEIAESHPVSDISYAQSISMTVLEKVGRPL